VDDLVADADDFLPRNLGMLVTELTRHVAASFADDLNEMGN
jgi:hypothetical protein